MKMNNQIHKITPSKMSL